MKIGPKYRVSRRWMRPRQILVELCAPISPVLRFIEGFETDGDTLYPNWTNEGQKIRFSHFVS